MKYRILFIDDKIMCVKLLKLKIEKIEHVDAKIFEIHWAIDLYMGKEMIKNKIYDYDLIICDIMGTTTKADDLNLKEEISHPDVIITSGILMPQKDGIVFATKENLAKLVADKIKLHQEKLLQ